MVEGARLESVYRGNSIEGSNPSLSASFLYPAICRLYANESPGWGIEVDEKAAAKYPFSSGERGGRRNLYNGGWGDVRKRDGTIVKQ